jgi:N-dimethylarginine dimethylaminohydrolase
MVQERTGRPADVLKQNEDSAHGGDGWTPRDGTLATDLGTIWAPCGVCAESDPLRAILMHRPGPEIEVVQDYRSALWLGMPDPLLARAQHDDLVDFYQSHGIAVYELGDVPEHLANAYFCRDTFAMSPTGAIISRMASAARAGEERWAAAALARIGVPIAHTVHGNGTFEGADVVIVNEDLVFVGHGMRTNRSGAEQVAQVYRDAGIPQVEIAQIPYGCGHIDGTLNIIDKDLALVFPTQLSWVVYETLKRHGFQIVDIPDMDESQGGMALNLVPLAPRVVVMPAGNPRTRAALEAAGVEVFEAEVSELMRGGGSIHCMTGVIERG